MRDLEGDQVLARVFVGETDTWHHRPLHRALLERLRQEGFAGATVLRGLEGFGARSVIHAATLLDMSGDLPIIIEVVETTERIDRLLVILDEMMTGGIVTLENVRVVRYAPRSPP